MRYRTYVPPVLCYFFAPWATIGGRVDRRDDVNFGEPRGDVALIFDGGQESPLRWFLPLPLERQGNSRVPAGKNSNGFLRPAMPVNLLIAYRAKLRRTLNIVTRMPRIDAENARDHQQESLQSLLYRYFCFQWLFFDMSLARGPIERRAAWLHNQSQREWLPAYMRRWAMLSTVGFALGAIGEWAFAAPVFAACWYTGSCVCVSVLAIIAVVWTFLGRNRPL